LLRESEDWKNALCAFYALKPLLQARIDLNKLFV